MKKYRIRLVTFHTGYHKLYFNKKRKVLANKQVYYQILSMNKKINTADFAADVEKMAHKFYSNVENIKVIIGSNGAPWIRNTSQYWPNSDYILDKFHALRSLKQLFATRNNQLNHQQYQTSKILFEGAQGTLLDLDHGTYPELISHLKTTILKQEKSQKLKEVLSYFHNNAVGITNQNLDYNIGVSAESDVSHIVKWLLGYGLKAFSYKTFKNMLLLRSAEINKLDIIAYLNNDYQIEQQKTKEFYWTNFWTFKKTKNYTIKGSVLSSRYIQKFGKF